MLKENIKRLLFLLVTQSFGIYFFITCCLYFLFNVNKGMPSAVLRTNSNTELWLETQISIAQCLAFCIPHDITDHFSSNSVLSMLQNRLELRASQCW